MGDRIGGPGAPGPHTKPDACPSCGAPGGKPPAGPCIDPFHGDPEPGLTQPREEAGRLPIGALRAEDTYVLGGEQLRSLLFMAAGACSAVFLQEDPEKEMPSEAILDAVSGFIEAPDTQEMLSHASKGARR
jgi:hypothetical protein